MHNGKWLSSSVLNRLFFGLATTVAISALVGCSGSFTGALVSPAALGAGLHGTILGGQQPLTGARVYLFAAGHTGYGSAASSLLNTTLPAVSIDNNGNGYVLTDATGAFTVTGEWTCPQATDQLYILATGGNPGLAPGTDNTAIAMMDVLGTCSTVSGSTFVVVNELSTVAATTALHQFMVDATHVGTSATNAIGLANAFAAATSMVDTAGGPARTLTPAGNGKVPQAKLHTLANILAACVNSSSNASSTCGALFYSANYNTGTPPTDTAVASLNIAKHPENAVGALFFLVQSAGPFQPTISSAPTDWTIGITYTLGGTTLPGYLAIDSIGDVWISNRASDKTPAGSDSIIELSPAGAVISGNGFTAGGVNKPEGLAIDDSDNVWVANTPGSVIKLTSGGSLASGFPVSAGSFPYGIAIDQRGYAWISNSQSNDVMVVTGSGVLAGSGFSSPGFIAPKGVAIDINGSVWIAGQVSNSILQLDPNGVVLSGSGAGFTGGGLNFPSAYAIDGFGNHWIVNSAAGNPPYSTFTKFDSDGDPLSISAGFGTGAPGYENLLAIDGASTVWSASCGPKCVGAGTDNVIHLANSGAVLTQSSGLLNADFDAPRGVAIDASGNLWIANTAGQGNDTPGTVTELVGVAVPVKTPVQAALKALLLGQRP